MRYMAQVMGLIRGKIIVKNNIPAALAILVTASFISGCATIVDGTTQSVAISTSPVQGAACTLTNVVGTYSATTPASIIVRRTKNDLTATCTKDGYEPGVSVAPATFGGATFGNIVLGGGVGAIVDAASGANYYYQSPITIPLGEKKEAK